MVSGLFVGLLLTSVAEAKSATPACSRFRVHLASELPDAPKTDPGSPLPDELAQAIESWQANLFFLRNDQQRERWIRCIRSFIFLDSDHDGIPDWTALVDGRPSRTLFPLDPDMDGDGIQNIFDPDPYTPNEKVGEKLVPKHLGLRGEILDRQARMWEEFGVLVVNHSDKHIPDSLDVAASVFNLKSIRNWSRQTRGVNVLYAFGGRSPGFEAAAYHPTAHAISLPGVIGFGTSILSPEQKCRLKTSILHELGHALLFGVISVAELKEKALAFGGWRFPGSLIQTMFSPAIFDLSNTRRQFFVSEYAETNVHEWFAESFAAHIWRKESLDEKECRAFSGKGIPKRFGQWIEALLERAKDLGRSDQSASQKLANQGSDSHGKSPPKANPDCALNKISTTSIGGHNPQDY